MKNGPHIPLQGKYLPLLIFAAFTGHLLLSCGSNDITSPIGESTSPRENAYIDSLINDVKSQVQNGDLLLRTGRDFSSEQVRDMSTVDKTYSHGGITIVENNRIYVYHVEPDYYHIKDKVRKEPIDSFIDVKNNAGFGLARYRMDSTEKAQFTAYLEEQYQKQIPFDMSFELSSDDSMYCSEMISKGLSLATEGRIQIKPIPLEDRSKFKQIRQYFKLQDNQFIHRPIIPIDRLFLHPACTLIRRYEYLR
jgi:hypothetical protein